MSMLKSSAYGVWLVACVLLISGCVSAREASAPLPTMTPSPTATRATPTASASPSPTPPPVATPNLAATVAAQQTPRVYKTLSSPDGMWEAEVLVYDCVALGSEGPEYAYEVLLLRATDGAIVQVDEQTIACGGLGAAGFDLLLWSPDSRYLYYTPTREGVPDGCGFWAGAVARFDVQTRRREVMWSAIFSPDRQRLAVIEPSALALWDVDGGEIARWSFPQEGVLAGVAWSPDGERVALLFVQTLCPPAGPSRLFLFDASSQEAQQVLATDEQTFLDVIWQASEHIQLVDDQGTTWTYSLTTGAMEPDER